MSGASTVTARRDLAPQIGAGTSHLGLRARNVGAFDLLADRGGRFLHGEPGIAQRYRAGAMLPGDFEQLQTNGLLTSSALDRLSRVYAEARRSFVPGPLDYIILVPTLRCNLACSYCQVSRAAVDARGFDWSESTLAAVKEIVGNLSATSVKIEFQGGEPTLRPDLIEAVIAAVPAHVDARYVICTNLQNIDDKTLALFDREDVAISTSLDGPLALHTRQRQGDAVAANEFLANFDRLRARYRPGKISALPTIDSRDPPEIDDLVDAFVAAGQHAIYLRPINYQGFARKRHPHSREIDRDWFDYHARFIERLIARNWEDRSLILEETYFSLLLRRIFRPGEDRHVDLRNPNPVGQDYVVIDHDGIVYPTDEARMLARSGIIDLAIGDVADGWDSDARLALDVVSTNNGDPACERCVYQAFCGRDIVDDIARYGTISLPREETDFCRRHLFLFDLAFTLIASDDAKVQYSLRRWLGLAGETGPLVTA